MSIFTVGLQGERRAGRYLRLQGYRILERRFRTRHGEIDLIAKDDETVVFVEVKTRPKGQAGDGLRAVNRDKQDHLRYAAQWYLRSHPAAQARFDVIEISRGGVRHIKNAF